VSGVWWGGLLAFLLLLLAQEMVQAQAIPVTITAYTRGWVTASGTRPRPGTLALSRDVERDLRVRFGMRVCLEGLGAFTFRDRMPGYWRRRVDLFLPSHQSARTFGRQQGVVQVCPE
jgi:3D (Asp-Asp-Asp) domain-containing protein